jgi:hypothetical protein
MPHCTEKSNSISPTGQLQSCLCESAEGTGEHHAQCGTPLPTLLKQNPVQLLGRLNPLNKTEQHKQQTNLSPTAEEGGWSTEPAPENRGGASS